MEPSHSDQATHIHNVRITVDGVEDTGAAHELIQRLVSAVVPVEGSNLSLSVDQENGVAEGSFPVCCFTSGGETKYGFCRFGVPGPCSPEYSGCPA